jgi:hypothetical protein
MCIQPCDLGTTYSSGSCSGTSTTYTWNNGSTNYQTTGVTSATTGKTNTATLITLTSDTDYPYKAAAACVASTYGGYSDWYLPSQGELDGIEQNYTAIGGFSTNYYWTSTEYNQSIAVEVRNPYANGTGTKSQGDDVRCVRHN